MSGTKVIPGQADQPKCPQCGTPLPSGVLTGLCPACLLKMGAQADTVTDARQPAFNPPSVPELAPLFPQLEIIELIGKGGMGAVYKARQKQLDRIVALKILPPGIGDDSAFAERFTREAKALAKLNHSGIVTLYEFGRAELPLSQEAAQQPRPTSLLYFFMMEFVDGVNLRQLLHAGRVSAREALAIVPQICDALQYAHDQGIVHRDIKPENILLDRRGRVKVADFGLAKIVGNELLTRPSDTLSPSDGERDGAIGDLVLTDAGKVMGTPQYMSPEQRKNPSEVDHRADIYALGVVFYQMLTGELPGKRIEPPSSKVQIDVRLDEVVLRALAQQPELRYQQASVLKTQVETIASSPLGGSSAASSPAWMHRGVDYRSKATLFGLPVVHVATGFDPTTGRQRVAKGIIAIGGLAKGVIAFGGMAMGGIACGGGAVGVIAIGGGAIGLISFGGLAIALLAAFGGGAVGFVALGGGALGYLTFGGGTIGVHAYDAITQDPFAERFFLPWAKMLMANIQWINFAVLVPLISIGVGVPLWLQQRQKARHSDDDPQSASLSAQPATSANWQRLVARSVLAGLIVGGLILAVAASVTLLMPDSFKATARVRLNRLVSPEATTSQRHDPQEIQDEVGLIQNGVIVGEVIKTLGLDTKWGRKYNRGEQLKTSVTLNIFRERLDVRPVGNSRMIDIGVFGESPAEAAEIANAIADSYREFHRQQVQAYETRPPRLVRSGELVTADEPPYYRIEIVERAVPALRAIRPHRPLNLFIGAVLGVLLGFAAGVTVLLWHLIRPPQNGSSQTKLSAGSDRLKSASPSQQPEMYPFWFGVSATFGGTILLGLLGELLLGHVLGNWLIALFVLFAIASALVAFLLRRFAGPELQQFCRTAGAWLAFLGALPMIGFAAFFVFALASESGGWNPATDEAMIVPLIWLGSVLLPTAGWRLSKGVGRAVGASAVAIVVVGSITVCVWSASAARVTADRARAEAVARLKLDQEALLRHSQAGGTNNPNFGSVIERMIKDVNEQQGDAALLLKTGELTAPPAGEEETLRPWLVTNRMDLMVGPVQGRWALMSFGLRLGDFSSTNWDSATPADVQRALLSKPSLERPTNVEMADRLYLLPDNPELPLTLAFQTSNHEQGLLQITGFTKNPRGVRIRYKLVQRGGVPKPITSSPSYSLFEPPQLRFVAWQDEWKTNAPLAARHPDGSLVTNATELEWLRVVNAGGMNTTYESQPRFLKLWFSHPAFQRTDFTEVCLFDENGRAVQRGANGASSSSLVDASLQNGWRGWRCWTGSPGEGTNLPNRLTVELRYAIGPLERTQEVPPGFDGTMSLEGNSILNGIGQNAQGQAFVAIAVDPETTRSRAFGVVARTKDGREIPHLGSGRSDFPGSGVAVARFEFATPLSSVAKFVIGTRVIHTNEWKDVILPGN